MIYVQTTYSPPCGKSSNTDFEAKLRARGQLTWRSLAILLPHDSSLGLLMHACCNALSWEALRYLGGLSSFR